jgi:hypothetical protein
MVAAPSDFGGFRPSPSVLCFGWPSVGIFDGGDRANLMAATVHRTGRLWAVFHGR